MHFLVQLPAPLAVLSFFSRVHSSGRSLLESSVTNDRIVSPQLLLSLIPSGEYGQSTQPLLSQLPKLFLISLSVGKTRDLWPASPAPLLFPVLR